MAYTVQAVELFRTARHQCVDNQHLLPKYFVKRESFEGIHLVQFIWASSAVIFALENTFRIVRTRSGALHPSV